MAFEFKSFEHFKQMRIKAAQWRAFDKQLKGAEGEALIRGVLQEPVIDNRTDQTYEKRLYEGFKEGMQRLREGAPLVNSEPPEPPKDQFREAFRSLGYLPSSPSAPQQLPSPRSPRRSYSNHRCSSSRPRRSSPRSRRSSSPRPWSPPISLIYPSMMFQRTPSPLTSPPHMPSSVALLQATPPCRQFPSPSNTPTRVFSPGVSALSPTPPPTPHVPHCPAHSGYSSSDEINWSPSSPLPTRQDFESASFQSAIAEKIQKQSAPEKATPTKAAPAKPAPVKPAPVKPASTKAAPVKASPKPKRRKQKRRKQQLKFSDETLKKVRPSPPITRRSKSQSVNK